MQVLKLLLDEVLHDEGHLAGVVPFKGFLVGVNLFGGDCELLDGKGAVGVVPEDGEDDVEGDALVGVQEVGDGHLSHSEHAAPAAIGIVVGGRKDLGYFGAIGHEDVLVVFAGLHFGLANQIY